MGRYKKGESGNPGGRPALPEDVRESRRLTSAQVTRILTKLIELSPTEFETYQPLTVLEKIVLQLCLKAMEEGCTTRLNMIFDRVIGKVKETLDVNLPQPFIVRRADGSTIEMGAKLNKKEGDQ